MAMARRIEMSKKYHAASWVDPNRWFERTGEYRPPKKGEYYISGAIPEVYKAPNDLSQDHTIATPIPNPPRTIEVDGFIYALQGAA
jgi:hypothetical protein